MYDVFHISKKDEFSKLYNENFDYVYSFIFTRSACDAQITEELVQETFSAAWQAQGRFLSKSSCRTWLCGIAKNKLYEHYRKSIGKNQGSFYDMESLQDQASSYDLESAVFENITKNQVAEVLGKLNPIYRYALVMKYVDGYSVREIAKYLGRTAKAVDGVLQKAKCSFIRLYSEMEGREDPDE